MVAWRYAESLPIGEQALALAREVGAREAEVRALTVLGGDLAFLGHGEEGLDHFRQALQLAEQIRDLIGLERAYVNFTDVLTMLGRPRESARVGKSGLEEMHRYGIESVLLVVNQIEALVAIGEWDEAERLSAAALRGITSSFRHGLMFIRGVVEIGRGEFESARQHLAAASAAPWEYLVLGLCDARLAELALWERRWTDAQAAIDAGLARARRHEAAQIRLQLCATGLRAHAELAALAGARRDVDAVRHVLRRARNLLTAARRAAADASAITPNADGWLAVAEAEYQRVRGVPGPELWSDAAETWDRLERPPLVAYCRWRQAEAVVAAGASRTEAIGPLREAFTRRHSDRGEAVVARTRTARPARPARSRRASRAARRTAHPGGDPWSHRARGRGPQSRRPRLHQPRDRRDTHHQRQDGERPRNAHPPQARRAEPARSRRHRASPHATPGGQPQLEG